MIIEAVTYSLKSRYANSENYYKDVREFTREVISEASCSVSSIIADFKEYLASYELEDIRGDEEYLLELISFGVLWRSYAYKALRVRTAPFITLARMSEWRKKHRRVKPLIDFSRGILLTLFLVRGKHPPSTAAVPSLSQVDHVCKWFEATGEFREQALRFIRWRAYWGTKNPNELNNIFSGIEKFTDWFSLRSAAVLGRYTANIESFLEKTRKRYRWREDRVSCGRTRLEYHLNMVGAELLNIAYRSEFTNTPSKVVLVPGCMRGRPQGECESVEVKEGLLCRGCLPKCRVNQLREMGKKHNFEVYIIPHASDLSLWSPKPGRPKLGVIASACVPTLVEGGWELKRYGVPAQCVLLESSGCKKHWGCDGLSTELNLRELKRIFFNEIK